MRSSPRRTVIPTLLLLAGTLLSAATPAPAAEEQTGAAPEIVVVVSPECPVDSLETDELRRIFLRKKTKWPDGEPITVYERHSDHPIRRQFSEAILDRSPEELSEYWFTLRVTRGIKPPRICRSASLLKQYLRRVKGGIGYVYRHETSETMKIVYVVGGSDAE